MDTPSENSNAENFNKLDLSALQGFQFGTQWSSAGAPGAKDASGRAKEDRGDGTSNPRRDRRPARRPQGGDGPQQASGFNDAGQRRDPRDHRDNRERGPRGEGGMRRGPGPGGRFERNEGERQPPVQFGYLSPHFEVTFYPDDVGFAALIKAMKSSGRTYELFQIANLLLEKNDRFVAVIKRTRAESAEGAAPVEGSAGQERSAPLFVAVPDSIVFETEDAAVRHVLSKHLAAFFDTEEVEVDAPKGNFVFVHKCPFSGELIGPPNYHRYNQLLQQIHGEKAADMPLEVYRNRLETVREPEAVAAWAEKMRKSVRYVGKQEIEGVRPQFSSREEASIFLTTRMRDKVVREAGQARVPGKAFDSLIPGEIRRAIEGALQRQRRFPLDTANALRGRLRREGLFLFKLPGKTITFVSAIKPRARRVGQVFSASIDPILTIIDNKPFIKLAEFEIRILGLDTPPAPAEAGGPPEFTAEQKEQLVKALRDLRWLVHEGYVVEFADGRLYALPAASSEAKAQLAVEEVGGGRRGEDPAISEELPPEASPSEEAP